MKTCAACTKAKGVESFYKAPSNSDGLMGICKDCHKERMRRNRIRNLDYYREYDRQRFKNDPKVRARHKRYQQSSRGRRIAKQCKRRWAEQNETKRRCHIMTGNAIRNGLLVKQPCEVCGDRQVHAHHDDYDKPLLVRWLCPKHHKQWHEENGEGRNAA